MGKGKRASGKHYTSKGERRSVNKKISNAVRSDYMQSQDRVLNQQRALAKGRDIVMTIANPNKEETNKRFIRVKVSGRDYVKNMKPYVIRGEVS
jgi:hypothetical protein